jgi:hypothetical protein
MGAMPPQPREGAGPAVPYTPIPAAARKQKLTRAPGPLSAQRPQRLAQPWRRVTSSIPRRRVVISHSRPQSRAAQCASLQQKQTGMGRMGLVRSDLFNTLSLFVAAWGRASVLDAQS